MSENWPDEEHAFFEEVMQRFKRGELSLEIFERVVSVVKEINRENNETLGHLEKILRKSNLRVVSELE